MTDFYAQAVDFDRELGLKFTDELPESDAYVFHRFESREEIEAYMNDDEYLKRDVIDWKASNMFLVRIEGKITHLTKCEEKFEFGMEPDEYTRAGAYYIGTSEDFGDTGDEDWDDSEDEQD